MTPPRILGPVDHIEPFRLPDKRAVGDLHPQLMLGVRGKMEAVGKRIYRPGPMIFRALIGFGGCVKISIFNVRTQNKGHRFGIGHPVRLMIGRVSKKMHSD